MDCPIQWIGTGRPVWGPLSNERMPGLKSWAEVLVRRTSHFLGLLSQILRQPASQQGLLPGWGRYPECLAKEKKIPSLPPSSLSFRSWGRHNNTVSQCLTRGFCGSDFCSWVQPHLETEAGRISNAHYEPDPAQEFLLSVQDTSQDPQWMTENTDDIEPHITLYSLCFFLCMFFIHPYDQV